MKKAKLLCLLMASVLTIASAVPVLADREDDLKAAVNANNNKLADTKQSINETQAAVDQLAGEIASLDDQLVALMSNIDVLKGDIASTEERIEQAKADLVQAEADRDAQYKAMSLRIRYIYENGGSDQWFSFLLKAETLTDMLNRAEYTQQLEKCDREMLTQFIACIEQVTETRNTLESVRSELEEQKRALEDQQAQLEQLLNEKRAASDNYTAELMSLRERADALTNEIYAQNAEITRIQAEKAEAARRAAEEEARRAAEEAARREEENRNNNNNNDNNDNNNNNNNGANIGNAVPPSPSTPDSGGSTGAPPSTIGGQVVAYAAQVLGNPYVWGGESLTAGCDCSGYVKAVYAHFGYSLPHSSAALAYVGTPVSYAEAQPGDIICYAGHVGIYVGNDTIINASNERDGIKYTSPATYRTIVAVRRIA